MLTRQETESHTWAYGVVGGGRGRSRLGTEGRGLEEGKEIDRVTWVTFLAGREPAVHHQTWAQSTPGETGFQGCPCTMWGAADKVGSRFPRTPITLYSTGGGSGGL